MKLTLQIKLLSDEGQAQSLLDTIKEANKACQSISEMAWERRCFQRFKLHKEVYYPIKNSFRLSSQMVVQCISKVADAYKKDRKKKKKFREGGAVTYDNRLLSYKEEQVSIWSVDGRLRIPFVCHRPGLLKYIRGEADLLQRNGKFFLFQTIDIPDQDVEDVDEFIGIDLGITDIAVDSEGTRHSSEWLNNYRKKQQKVRGSIQRKGTRSARKLLKRRSRRERTTARIVNHTISKQLVEQASKEGKGISLEALEGIRNSGKRKGKKFNERLGKWSFFDLRKKIEYKAALKGVPVVLVPPQYTSKTCSGCKHIGKRSGKKFRCTNYQCKVDVLDADENAAQNIALLGGAVNRPERSDMYSCAIHGEV